MLMFYEVSSLCTDIYMCFYMKYDYTLRQFQQSHNNEDFFVPSWVKKKSEETNIDGVKKNTI